MDNRRDGPFRPIRTRRTFEEAVEQIAEVIASRQMGPGDRLPSERALADAMEVGRPTIREALKVLAHENVIELVGTGRNRGAYIRTDAVPPNLVEDQTSMRVSEVAGVLISRRVLEPRVAQLAALERTDQEVERLTDLVRLQENAVGDRTRFLDLDLRFHLEVGRCTHNSTIEALMMTLIRRVEKAYDLALRDPGESTWAIALKEHKAIVKGIAGRDPERADEAMATHLTLLEKLWESHSGYSLRRKLPDFVQAPA